MPDSLPATILAFDYSTLPARDRKALKMAAADVRKALRRTVEEMLRVGGALATARNFLEHGQFEAWVVAETGMSPRMARLLIAAFERFYGQGKSEIISDLTPTAVLRLAAAPEEAIKEVAQRKKAGEQVRVADVERIIRESRGDNSESKSDAEAKSAAGEPKTQAQVQERDEMRGAAWTLTWIAEERPAVFRKVNLTALEQAAAFIRRVAETAPKKDRPRLLKAAETMIPWRR